MAPGNRKKELRPPNPTGAQAWTEADHRATSGATESAEVRRGRLTSYRLNVPPNITLIPLPPKCPELNAEENVWQFMRVDWRSNLVLESFDDTTDHGCQAWNKLINQPWRIMSLGHSADTMDRRSCSPIARSKDWTLAHAWSDGRFAHIAGAARRVAERDK